MSELIALSVRLGALKFLVVAAAAVVVVAAAAAAAAVVVVVVPDLDLLLMPL